MNEEKREMEMVNLLTSLCQEAIRDHCIKAEKRAAELCDSSDDKPVKAKLGLSIEWNAGAMQPMAKVKVSYSVKTTEEYESAEELGQIKFAFDQPVSDKF
jgi:hypothetical protein